MTRVTLIVSEISPDGALTGRQYETDYWLDRHAHAGRVLSSFLTHLGLACLYRHRWQAVFLEIPEWGCSLLVQRKAGPALPVVLRRVVSSIDRPGHGIRAELECGHAVHRGGSSWRQYGVPQKIACWQCASGKEQAR